MENIEKAIEYFKDHPNGDMMIQTVLELLKIPPNTKIVRIKYIVDFEGGGSGTNTIYRKGYNP